MKKYLLLIASAALLLAGCQKEQFAGGKADGEMVEVTFTASIPGTMTKAAIDEDGAAACINHWIMEVRDASGNIFNRQEKDGSVGDKTQTFTVRLVKNHTYDFSFWADTKGAYNTDNLTAVSYVDHVANKDSRDAFSCNKHYTSSASEAVEAELKRPFGQLNIITTDLAELWNTINWTTGDVTNANGAVAEYAAFAPADLVVKAKFPTVFNVKEQTCGQPSTETIVLTADKIYELKNEYTSHEAKSTMFMDYIFASAATKDVIDFDFHFVSNGQSINHVFTAIPIQRNYRTNIVGNFLSNEADWTVTVNPEWNTPDYDVPYFVASSITEAQSYIAPTEQGTEKSKAVDLTGAEITQEDVDEDNTIHLVLKLTSPVDLVNFTLPEIPSGVNAEGWTITYDNEQYSTKNVGVNAPEGTKVVINAPNSHVTVTGTSYAEIVASTNANTLVIPEGVIVEKLIVKKGNVEVFGEVNEIDDQVEGGCKLTWHVNTIEKFNKAFAGNEKVRKADVIVLEADITATEAFEVSSNLVLDLNGHVLSAGELTGNTGLFTVLRGAKLTVNDATNEGAIRGETRYSGISLTKNGETSEAAAELEVNGGSISGRYYAIAGNGSRHNTKITVNGGKLFGTEPEDNLAIFNPQEGFVTITGGELTGALSAIEMRAGVLAIEGGKFTATAKTFSYNANGSGSTVTGAAIAESMHTTGKSIKVTIKGGEFYGVKGVAQVNTTGITPEAPDFVTLAIEGGQFNGDIYSQEKTGFIKGGQFLFEPKAEYIVEGSLAKKTGVYYEIFQEKEDIYATTVGMKPGDEGMVWDGESTLAVVGRDQTSFGWHNNTEDGDEIWPFMYAFDTDTQGNKNTYNLMAKTDLEEIYIANSIPTIPATFFGFAKKVKEIHFEGGCDMNFEENIFYGCDSLTDIYFDNLPTSISGTLKQGAKRFIGSDGPRGLVITIHVPNGWLQAGYPSSVQVGDGNQAIIVVEDR